MTRRRDLLRDEPEHPRADEPYFKVQLGPLQQLSRPIPAKRWRRVTFLYTTGERLHAAEDVHDLRVADARTRSTLWGWLDRRLDRS